MKKIRLPVKLTIGIDKVEGEIQIVRFDLKYRASLDDYPEFPEMSLNFKPALTESQESAIIGFCRDVILPQVEQQGAIDAGNQAM